ncbi:MAG: VWA domain-containing protein [bacterium]
MSLISFSGVPVVSIPFSQDSRAVAYAVNDLSLADFPAAPEFLGTAIGDALLLGAKNLQQFTGSLPGIMILITDGDSNEGYDPVQVITLLRKQHISVSTLGIGNNNYLIGYDQWQQPISTSLNTDLLQNIAQQTS